MFKKIDTKTKISLILCIFTLILSSCSGMPLQGMSTANYAYKPPYVSTYETVYKSGDRTSYRKSTTTRSYPENAFKSLRESTRNLERISNHLEDITNNIDGTF